MDLGTNGRTDMARAPSRWLQESCAFPRSPEACAMTGRFPQLDGGSFDGILSSLERRRFPSSL